MGQYAEDIIDGFCDNYGDYNYKHYNRPIKYNKEALNNIRLVRKELAKLIETYISSNVQNPVNTARRDINLKYGRNWRERGLILNSPNQWKPLSEYK